MTSPNTCPTPPGCRWEQRTLNDISMHVCTACGQVRMDQSALQRLAGPIQTPAPPTPTRGGQTPTKPAYRAPPVPPLPGASFLGGVTLSPAPPPPRAAEPTPSLREHIPFPPSAPTLQGPSTSKATPKSLWRNTSSRKLGITKKAPHVSRATPRPTPIMSVKPRNPTLAPSPELNLTPGAPPQRAPTPLPPDARSIPGMNTVLPFSEVQAHDDLATPTPRATSAKASTSLQGRSVRPQSTWVPDQIPTTVDDSRVPTDELTAQEVSERLGLRASVSSSSELQELGLRSAITRHDEPDLGLGHASRPRSNTPGLPPVRPDGFLDDETEEMERFFSEETKVGAGRRRRPADSLDDLDYKRRRPIGLALLMGGAIGLIALAAVGLGVVYLNPNLDLQSVLSASPAQPSAPSLQAMVNDADQDTEPDVIPTPDPDAQAPSVDATVAGSADEAGAADDAGSADDSGSEGGAGSADHGGSEDGAGSEPSDTPAVAPAHDEHSATPAPKAPAPDPKPAPKVTKPTRPSYRSMVQNGWNAVDVDPDKAADIFRQAMDLRPGDAEASYGLGYALLKSGQKNGARAYLCSAKRTADPTTHAELEAVLSKAELSCD